MGIKSRRVICEILIEFIEIGLLKAFIASMYNYRIYFIMINFNAESPYSKVLHIICQDFQNISTGITLF